MSDFFEELDYQETNLGTLTLRRRREPMAKNADVFEVKLDDDFLMSSLFTVGETALANIALDILERPKLDVLIGGLGLGFTANAALEHKSVRTVIVIETLDAVLSWHQKALVPLGQRLISDPRCQLIHGDFFKLASFTHSESNPAIRGRQFDAILLDIDHSPNHLLNTGNSDFYTVSGMKSLVQMLRPKGVFAMWSNDPPEKEFSGILQKVFRKSHAEVVAFPNPYSNDPSSCTIYLGEKH
mgnify:CR=1 FL=1